jgi:parallel beta-helix repeat protein
VRAVILGLAAAAVLAIGPSPALADIQCGDTLTKSVKLKRDLVNCPGDGLVIGADNVKVDLNGHTLDGDGSGIGIANVDGHDGVQVRDGKVQEFSIGIVLRDTANGKLRKVNVRNNTGDGIALEDSRGNRIEDSRATGNGSDGITLYRSTGNRIEENSTAGNEAHGIVLETESNGNRVDANRVYDNHSDGISIAVNSSGNYILSNRVRRNSGSVGIFVVFDSNENRVRKNVIEENGGGGILVMDADANKIEKNRSYANGRDGIQVDAASGGTSLKENAANGNSGDGIDIAGVAGKVTKNEAHSNLELGIRAALGVTDGGGNKATGNGDSRQCTDNIACAVPGAAIDVAPSHVDFGVRLHHSFTKKSFTVTNRSQESLTVTIDSTFVPDDFSPGHPESTCPWGTPTTLAPRESCTHVIGYYADPAEPFRGPREIELQVVARDQYGTVAATRTVKVTAQAVSD